VDKEAESGDRRQFSNRRQCDPQPVEVAKLSNGVRLTSIGVLGGLLVHFIALVWFAFSVHTTARQALAASEGSAQRQEEMTIIINGVSEVNALQTQRLGDMVTQLERNGERLLDISDRVLTHQAVPHGGVRQP